ncbi:MAG: carboxypeptidase-like regulatory domain-containing protein [Planctomycetales bacterium]|nr:carboxypeptidase-like regulatory domain-containing protein [Planctomycetales bacterium]
MVAGLGGRALAGIALALAAAGVASADEVAGTVTDEGGKPVAGTEVTLELGRARFRPTPNYDGWHSVKSEKGKTDSAGQFLFKDLPAGAMATVHVQTGTGFGIATGPVGPAGQGPLTVRMRPLGGVRGTVLGKKSKMQSLRLWVTGGDGFRGREGSLEKNGSFQVDGLAPGAATIYVMFSNFTMAEAPVTIKVGEVAPVPPIPLGEDFLPGEDPLVDCTKVKLVDSQGRPVPEVQLIWSSAWMDGGMNSDEKGVVLLMGGGVAIGGPPYRLRLASLSGKDAQYGGTLKAARGSTATVELRPLREVTGTVRLGKSTLADYLVLGATSGKTGRVYWGRVEAGRFRIHVPEGPVKLVVGAASGKSFDHDLDVPALGVPFDHDIVLPEK